MAKTDTDNRDLAEAGETWAQSVYRYSQAAALNYFWHDGKPPEGLAVAA